MEHVYCQGIFKEKDNGRRTREREVSVEEGGKGMLEKLKNKV